jgi:hypothetical protein
MKPSCEIVDHASTALMSLAVVPIVAAKIAVNVPVAATPSTSGREHRVAATEQEHAGGDHRRGVDHRAHRRRTGHRVGQPDVQRELRRLADRAAEDEEPGDRHPQRVLAGVQRLMARDLPRSRGATAR